MKKTKIILVFLMALFFFLNLSMAQVRIHGELKRISFAKLEDKLEVRMEVAMPFEYKSFFLSDPNRLVVDLLQVRKFSCDPHIEVVEFGVKAIRVARFQSDVTRIVFDLAGKPPSYKITETSEGLLAVFWFKEEKKKKEIEAEKIPTEIKKEVSEEKKTPVEKVPLEIEKEVTIEKEYLTISLGAHAGFHFMHAIHFQDVYGKSSPFTGLEAAFQFPLRKKEYIGISLGFKFISDNGVSGFEKSDLEITPVAVSTYYSRRYGLFSPYIGLGADYYNYSETSPETISNPIYSKKIWGAHILAGTYVHLTDFLSLKLFFKYQNASLKEDSIDINLGGNTYGLGLAYHFNIKI